MTTTQDMRRSPATRGNGGPLAGGSQALTSDQLTQAAAFAAIARGGMPLLPTFGAELAPVAAGPGMLVTAWRFGRTCTRAAKLLPTVRHAIPRYVWPILGLASVVKCMPLDFGADETLFAIAFALIAWRRPGLLKALYREAQAGKPARCGCQPCAVRKAKRNRFALAGFLAVRKARMAR